VHLGHYHGLYIPLHVLNDLSCCLIHVATHPIRHDIYNMYFACASQKKALGSEMHIVQPPCQNFLIQMLLNKISMNNTLSLSNLPYSNLNSVHIECIVDVLLFIFSPIFTMLRVTSIHVMNNLFMWLSNLCYSYLNSVHIESIDFALLSIFGPIFRVSF
jgi:hypothetical protein